MKYDIVLAGVGGQGVLSLAAIIATAAMEQGLNVRQSEVHGMAQRGGAVLAHLRIADTEIHSDLIGDGLADMVLSMEPMEALRYTNFLKADGIIVTGAEPFINIPNYPDTETIYTALKKYNHSIVESSALAKEAGSTRAGNMVLIGAASKFLPIKKEMIENAVKTIFSKKGDAIIETNLKAIELGKNI